MDHLSGPLIGLFTIATAVALLVRWVRIPYTVGLVVARTGPGNVDARLEQLDGGEKED